MINIHTKIQPGRYFNVSRALPFLCVIIILASVLRIYGIGWGLPDNQRPFFGSLMPDENDIVNAILVKNNNLNFYFNPYWFFWGGTAQFGLTSLTLKALRIFIPLKVIPVTQFSGGYPYAVYPDENHTYRKYPGEYGKLFLVGRISVAFFGVLTVWLVFLIGKKLFSVEAGLLGALLLAIAPEHVFQSHFLKQDIMVAFGFTLCALCILKIVNSGKGLWYILSGLTLGATAAFKFSGFLGIILVVIAHLSREGQELRLSLLSVYTEFKKLRQLWLSIAVLSIAIAYYLMLIFKNLILPSLLLARLEYSAPAIVNNQYGQLLYFLQIFLKIIIVKIKADQGYFILTSAALLVLSLMITYLASAIARVSAIGRLLKVFCDRRLLYCTVVIILVYFILSPFCLFTPLKAIQDFLALTKIHHSLYSAPTLEVGPKNGMISWVSMLTHALGMPLAVISLIATAFFLWRKEETSKPVIYFIISYYLILSFSHSVVMLRYLLPIIPFLCLIAAGFLLRLVEFLFKKDNKLFGRVFLGICIFVLIYTLSYSFNYVQLMANRDTVVKAGDWIEKNIKVKSSIGCVTGIDIFRAPVSYDNYHFVDLKFSIAKLEKELPDYLATVDYGPKKISAEADKYASISSQAAFYDYLLRRSSYAKIKSFLMKEVSVFGFEVDKDLSALNLRKILNPHIVIYKRAR